MNTISYKKSYHSIDLSKYRFLVTGGAGFIGSNLVEYLLTHNAGHVRVLDDLSNGYYENIQPFVGLPNFEFIEGDIRDFSTCVQSVDSVDFISHQAALGSVPRSIKDPITSNEVNVGGFLNMLVAAKESKTLKRFVYAASSSTYGDSIILPKVEGREGKPLSPYAVTKAVNEYYADVFSKIYQFSAVGLRYFNVFGPKQNQNNPYAAVIPLFCDCFLNKKSPTIYGDGLTTRDFTFVENVIQANLLSFEYNPTKSEVFNVACGKSVSLLQIIDLLKKISGLELLPRFQPTRSGDVRDSLASIDKASELLGYSPLISFEEGLEIVYKWYKDRHLKIENLS